MYYIRKTTGTTKITLYDSRVNASNTSSTSGLTTLTGTGNDAQKLQPVIPVAADSSVILSASDEIVLSAAEYGRLNNGDELLYSSSANITGLATGTVYYVRKTSSSTKIKLFDSRAEALNTSSTTGLRSLSGTGHAAQTLTFTLTADTAALSVHGSAHHIAFTQQISGCQLGVACSTQPVVAIQDDQGRLVTTGSNSTRNVTLSKASGMVFQPDH